MCLIIGCPQGTDKYSKKVLEAISNSYGTGNNDGFGYAIYDTKLELLVFSKKLDGTVDEFIKTYKEYNAKPEDIVMIHLRNGNIGYRELKNVHPFIVSNNIQDVTRLDKSVIENYAIEGLQMLMMHNGTFHTYNLQNHGACDYSYSDTVKTIVDLFGVPELKELLVRDTVKFKSLFDTRLGTNKLLFLTNTGKFIKLGAFSEDEGYWFSNDTYKGKTTDKGGETNAYKSRLFSGKEDMEELSKDKPRRMSFINDTITEIIVTNIELHLTGVSKTSDLQLKTTDEIEQYFTEDYVSWLKDLMLFTPSKASSLPNGIKLDTLYMVDEVTTYSHGSSAIVRIKEFQGLNDPKGWNALQASTIGKHKEDYLFIEKDEDMVDDLSKLVMAFVILHPISKTKCKKLKKLYDSTRLSTKHVVINRKGLSTLNIGTEALGCFLKWLEYVKPDLSTEGIGNKLVETEKESKHNPVEPLDDINLGYNEQPLINAQGNHMPFAECYD